MDIAVSPGMARRRGATKEHVLYGPVTEEQRSRRAIIGETLRAEAFLSCGLVARRVQVREGHGHWTYDDVPDWIKTKSITTVSK